MVVGGSGRGGLCFYEYFLPHPHERNRLPLDGELYRVFSINVLHWFLVVSFRCPEVRSSGGMDEESTKHPDAGM